MEKDFGRFIKGKKVLVTGGTGSIGSALVKHLLMYKPSVVRILSRDAAKQIELRNELGDVENIRFLLGDIRDIERLAMACEDINVIFHAAAFKHIPQGEYNPFEVIQTNVIGTQNLISVAIKFPSVTHFLMVSTDKAVQPVNTMGASKLLAERLVSATHYIKGKKNKTFTTIRLGNVLGTSGSVLSLFEAQAKKGEIILTHPDMLRFFMTLRETVDFIFKATLLARGGEIFVPKIPAVAVKDLAEVLANSLAKKPKIRIGAIRPGESVHESLLTPEEATSALETKTMFIILPQVEVEDFSPKTYQYPGAKPLSSPYTTMTTQRLSKKEIEKLLSLNSRV